jgi:sortase (surface protein transpeptidase)
VTTAVGHGTAREPRHRAPRRSRPVLRLVLGVLAVATGALALLLPGSPPPAAATAPGPVVLAGGTLTGSAAGTAAPLRVRVPAIGVDSTLVGLGTDAAGALAVPADPTAAGWYTGGPVPGDVGPAVVAGHVDAAGGPAVFARLRELAPGDEVAVDRSDGTTARFTVTRVERHPKDAFPTAAVYGPTPDAQLRLVTCGGAFDRAAGSYEDNVVVFATLVR